MTVRALQSALAAEAKRAEEAIRVLLERLARAHLDPLHRERADLVLELAALLETLAACGDLSGRVEVLTGRPGAKPEKFATERDPWQRVWTPRDVERVVEDAGPQGLEVMGSVPAVLFEEAVRDIEARDPIGAETLRRAGLEVADVYGPLSVGGVVTWPHGFAAARAASDEVAKRVREKLLAGLVAGTPTEDVAREIAGGWDWPEAYSRTVVRTTFATATTAGRFREAERVHDAGIRTGFVIESAGDSDVRSGRPRDNGENHAAMDGFAARVDDPVWLTHSPPYGYACRCLARVIVGDEVPASFQRPPAEARFAPGFGRKASRGTYG